MRHSSVQATEPPVSRVAVRSIRAAAVVVTLALTSQTASANYLCAGPVGYLGIGAAGDVTVSIANSTPVHYICNLTSQGSYAMSIPACKAAYSAIMAARLTGKAMAIYYSNDTQTCSTLPSWGAVPGVYFVQGPD